MTSIATDLGKQKLAAAAANGTVVNIHSMVLGSADAFPDGTETELQNEVYRDLVSARGIEGEGSNIAYFSMTVPENGDEAGFNYGPWQVWQWGLVDDQGDLIAIGRFGKVVTKPDPEEEGRAIDVTARIIFDDVDAINISYQAHNNLPFASNEEFQNTEQTGVIPEVAQIHAFLSDEYIPRRIRGAYVGDDEEDELSHHLPFVADQFFVVANGAVVIELPPLDLATFDRTFLAFDVAIDYGVPAEIARYRIGGFLVEHEGEATWVHRKVLFASGDHLKAVRYYTDGTRWFVVIGETTDASTHTSVTITDLAVAFRGADEITWDAEWSISVLDDIQGTLRATIEPTKFVSNDDLISMVRNNDVYPNARTANKQLALTDDGAGSVSIDAGQSFVWRGLIGISLDDFDLADRSFVTAANKTYHVRWHAPGTGGAVPEGDWPNGRFELFDLADPTYNPSAFDETHASFDTRYDDMLIARIITDGLNVATITPLINQPDYHEQFLDHRQFVDRATNGTYRDVSLTYNLAVTPSVLTHFLQVSTSRLSTSHQGFGGSDTHDHDTNIAERSRDRYHVAHTVYRDYGFNFTLEHVVQY